MADQPGNVALDTHVLDLTVTAQERDVLRRLAARVGELAARPIEREKRELWYRHNALDKTVRPLIFCDPERGWQEIITPDQMETTHELPRCWEYRLRKEIFWAERMNDDRVTEPWFNLFWVYRRGDWGVHEQYHGDANGGARNWEPPLKNLDDLSALRFQSLEVDRPATELLMGLAEETLGEVLPVRLRGAWYWTLGLTWEAIKLRGLESLMLDLYENPEGVHRLMAFLRDGTLDLLDRLEREGLFTLNNEGDYVGSGGFGWTRDLPAAGFSGRVRTCDLWCLCESQETVGVSPAMFGEFVFPYQQPLMDRFGRVCYGCCEGLHNRWSFLSGISRLRRVSVSPWADRAQMAGQLRDRYIYSLKPHPGLLAGDTFSSDAVRADIRDALEKAKGCRLEVIMKDSHTIRGQPQRVIDWCRLIREEIGKSGA